MIFNIPVKHIAMTIVSFGLPFAVLMTIVNYLLDGHIQANSFLLNFFGFGLFMGVLTLFKQKEDLHQLTKGKILPEHWQPLQEKQLHSSMSLTEVAENLKQEKPFKNVKLQKETGRITFKTNATVDSFFGQKGCVEQIDFENHQFTYRIQSRSFYFFDQMGIPLNLKNIQRISALLSGK